MKSRRIRVLVLLVAVGVFASACASGSATSGRGASYGEGADWVSGLAAHAVSTALVVDSGPVPAGDLWEGEDRASLRLGSVEWQGVLNPDYPAPILQPGDEIEVVIVAPDALVSELVPGSSYLFFLGHGYQASGETTWFVELVTDLDGNLVAAYDTSATQAVIGAVLLPGETKEDAASALIEFNAQQVTELRAYPQERGVSSRTSRVRKLAESKGDEGAVPVGDPSETWSRTSASERYLPSDAADVPEWMSGVLGAELVPYEVLVIGDAEGLMADVDSLSLFFPEAGIMGRHIVDHVTGITGISGMAPEGWRANLVAWTLDQSGDLNAQPDVSVLVLPATNKAVLTDEGVTIVIDLRTKPTPAVDLLSRESFDKLILELQPALSKQEADPFDPEPKG